MPFLRLYIRVLAQLGAGWRLAVALVLANLALAAALFAEPVLFGRIIDRLATDLAEHRLPSFAELAPLSVANAVARLRKVLSGKKERVS